MASGYGINGGTSRCFPFWQAVVKCYTETDSPGKCTLHKEDYNECLHHTKAKAKQARIKAEVARIRADGIAEARRQAEIYKAMGRAGDVKVGLIEHILSTRSVPTKHEGSDASKASATKVRVDWEVPGKKKE